MALRPKKDQNPPDPAQGQQAAEDEVFMREVDDAVREDQLAQFAKKFGVPLLVLIVAGLAVLGGWLWWQDSHETARAQHSEELVRAIDRVNEGSLDTAAKALDPVIKDGDDGTKAAAQMLRAGVAMEQGRTAEATRMFAAISADDSAPQPFRDLATIRETAINFDSLKPDEVVSRLKTLATPGNPWFGSAGELVGLAYLKQGKPDLAGPLFAEIAKDEDQPDSLRARARQLSGLLGVDAIVDVDKLVSQPAEGAIAPAQ